MEPGEPDENDSVRQPSFPLGFREEGPGRKPVTFRGIGADVPLRADEGTANGLPLPHRGKWVSDETEASETRPEAPEAPSSGETT
jgi:hypothetical protein